MKWILFLFPIITNTMIAKAQLKRDTLYINKEANQVVFMDTPHSMFHDQVFKHLLPDSLVNETNLPPMVSPQKGHSNFLGQWITVKKYKHKFVAYHPSEPFYNSFLRVSDSTILFNDFNDGFVTYTIKSRKGKKKAVNVELTGEEGVRHSLLIKQKKKTIFVIESSLFRNNKVYVVKRNNYYDFPILVNYCPTNRCPEYDF